jgi:hypothetical protein
VNQRRAPACFSKGQRHVVHRDRAERVSFAKIKIGEFRSAEPSCVFKNGLKDRLQLAERRANDLEHLRRGGLLLVRLLKFACLALELFLQIGNGRMVAARHRRTARHLSSLVTPCFHCFTAKGAMPSCLALQFGQRTIPYHSIELRCASQQNTSLDFRHGSQADMDQLKP